MPSDSTSKSGTPLRRNSYSESADEFPEQIVVSKNDMKTVRPKSDNCKSFINEKHFYQR